MKEEYTSQGGQPDLSGLIGTLLSNPTALSTLSSLLSSGIGGKGQASQKEEPCEEEHREAQLLPPPQKRPVHTDNRACLLNALRPYLSPSRCDTIDSLLRILELMELLHKRR